MKNNKEFKQSNISSPKKLTILYTQKQYKKNTTMNSPTKLSKIISSKINNSNNNDNSNNNKEYSKSKTNQYNKTRKRLKLSTKITKNDNNKNENNNENDNTDDLVLKSEEEEVSGINDIRKINKNDNVKIKINSNGNNKKKNNSSAFQYSTKNFKAEDNINELKEISSYYNNYSENVNNLINKGNNNDNNSISSIENHNKNIKINDIEIDRYKDTNSTNAKAVNNNNNNIVNLSSSFDNEKFTNNLNSLNKKVNKIPTPRSNNNISTINRSKIENHNSFNNRINNSNFEETVNYDNTYQYATDNNDNINNNNDNNININNIVKDANINDLENSILLSSRNLNNTLTNNINDINKINNSNDKLINNYNVYNNNNSSLNNDNHNLLQNSVSSVENINILNSNSPHKNELNNNNNNYFSNNYYNKPVLTSDQIIPVEESPMIIFMKQIPLTFNEICLRMLINSYIKEASLVNTNRESPEPNSPKQIKYSNRSKTNTSVILNKSLNSNNNNNNTNNYNSLNTNNLLIKNRPRTKMLEPEVLKIVSSMLIYQTDTFINKKLLTGEIEIPRNNAHNSNNANNADNVNNNIEDIINERLKPKQRAQKIETAEEFIKHRKIKELNKLKEESINQINKLNQEIDILEKHENLILSSRNSFFNSNSKEDTGRRLLTAITGDNNSVLNKRGGTGKIRKLTKQGVLPPIPKVNNDYNNKDSKDNKEKENNGIRFRSPVRNEVRSNTYTRINYNNSNNNSNTNHITHNDSVSICNTNENNNNMIVEQKTNSKSFTKKKLARPITTTTPNNLTQTPKTIRTIRVQTPLNRLKFSAISRKSNTSISISNSINPEILTTSFYNLQNKSNNTKNSNTNLLFLEESRLEMIKKTKSELLEKLRVIDKQISELKAEESQKLLEIKKKENLKTFLENFDNGGIYKTRNMSAINKNLSDYKLRDAYFIEQMKLNEEKSKQKEIMDKTEKEKIMKEREKKYFENLESMKEKAEKRREEIRILKDKIYNKQENSNINTHNSIHNNTNTNSNFSNRYSQSAGPKKKEDYLFYKIEEEARKKRELEKQELEDKLLNIHMEKKQVMKPLSKRELDLFSNEVTRRLEELTFIKKIEREEKEIQVKSSIGVKTKGDSLAYQKIIEEERYSREKVLRSKMEALASNMKKRNYSKVVAQLLLPKIDEKKKQEVEKRIHKEKFNAKAANEKYLRNKYFKMTKVILGKSIESKDVIDNNNNNANNNNNINNNVNKNEDTVNNGNQNKIISINTENEIDINSLGGVINTTNSNTNTNIVFTPNNKSNNNNNSNNIRARASMSNTPNIQNASIISSYSKLMSINHENNNSNNNQSLMMLKTDPNINNTDSKYRRLIKSNININPNFNNSNKNTQSSNNVDLPKSSNNRIKRFNSTKVLTLNFKFKDHLKYNHTRNKSNYSDITTNHNNNNSYLSNNTNSRNKHSPDITNRLHNNNFTTNNVDNANNASTKVKVKIKNSNTFDFKKNLNNNVILEESNNFQNMSNNNYDDNSLMNSKAFDNKKNDNYNKDIKDNNDINIKGNTVNAVTQNNKTYQSQIINAKMLISEINYVPEKVNSFISNNNRNNKNDRNTNDYYTSLEDDEGPAAKMSLNVSQLHQLKTAMKAIPKQGSIIDNSNNNNNSNNNGFSYLNTHIKNQSEVEMGDSKINEYNNRHNSKTKTFTAGHNNVNFNSFGLRDDDNIDNENLHAKLLDKSNFSSHVNSVFPSINFNAINQQQQQQYQSQQINYTNSGFGNKNSYKNNNQNTSTNTNTNTNTNTSNINKTNNKDFKSRNDIKHNTNTKSNNTINNIYRNYNNMNIINSNNNNANSNSKSPKKISPLKHINDNNPNNNFNNNSAFKKKIPLVKYPNYLNDIRQQRLKSIKHNKELKNNNPSKSKNTKYYNNEDYYSNTSVMEDQKWKKMIENVKSSMIDNINKVKMEAHLLEEKAKQREKFLRTNGGLNNNTGEKVSDLLIQAIEAKLAILDHANKK